MFGETADSDGAESHFNMNPKSQSDKMMRGVAKTGTRDKKGMEIRERLYIITTDFGHPRSDLRHVRRRRRA
jgi:hypothetical protein